MLRASSVSSLSSVVKEVAASGSYLETDGTGTFEIPVQKFVRINGLIGKSNGGILGPGHICVDKYAAVIGSLRVISANLDVEPSERGVWRAAATWLCKRMMSCYAASNPEWRHGEDPVERYERVAAGKPQSVRTKTIAEWRLMMETRTARAKQAAYRRNAFPKDESNFAKGQARPRLICPMSPFHALELAATADVADNFHRVPEFSGSHVKHKTTEEVSWMLWNVMDRHKRVTDYSSFEASLNTEGRTLERMFIVAALRYHGENSTANLFEEVTLAEQKLKVKVDNLSLIHTRRCSGDYWTSFGNWTANMMVVFLSYVETGLSYEASWNRIFAPGCEPGTGDVMEGDDGLAPESLIKAESVSKWGFLVGTSTAGDQADFLRKWYPNPPTVSGPVVNILRVMRSCMWLRGPSLKASRRRFLLRCAGWSAHCLSPGHPVLVALVRLIGRLTLGAVKFKGSERYYGRGWVEPPLDNFDKMCNLVVNESLRGPVATGRGPEVPGMDVDAQLRIEQALDRCMTGAFIVDPAFEVYPEYGDMIESSRIVYGADVATPPVDPNYSPKVIELLRSLRDPSLHPHPLVRRETS
jgi:hypothetical protein